MKKLIICLFTLSLLSCEKPVETPVAEEISYPVKYSFQKSGNPSEITSYNYGGKISGASGHRTYTYDPLKNITPQMDAENQRNMAGKLTLTDSSKYTMTTPLGASAGFYSRTNDMIVLSGVKGYGVLYFHITDAGLVNRKYYAALPGNYPDVNGVSGQLGRKALEEVIEPLVDIFDTCSARTYEVSWIKN